MKVTMYLKVYFLALLFSGLVGCVFRRSSDGMVKSDGGVNSQSSMEWDAFKFVITGTVQRELEGLPVGGGFESWNDRWENTIRNNREHGSPEEYIDFIINERRRVGLPELHGSGR